MYILVIQLKNEKLNNKMKRNATNEDQIRELANAGLDYKVHGYCYGWRFERQGSYWSVNVTNGTNGLELGIANELHNKPYPAHMFEDCSIKTYGSVIRVQGHAGAPPPEEWVNFDWDSVRYHLKELKISEAGITPKQIKDMIREGKLPCKLYVNTYHIDTQEGLNEFIRTIRKPYEGTK